MKNRKDRKAAWIFVLLLFFFFGLSSPLFAHRILMKNGRVYEGKILRQSRTEMVIESDGKEITLQKSDIDQVQYGPAPVKVAKPVRQTAPIKLSPPAPPVAKPVEEATSLNRWNIAGRSALLPGWGQVTAGEKRWGYGSGAATFGFLFLAYKNRRTALTSRQSYENEVVRNFLVVPSLNVPGGTGGALFVNAYLGALSYNSYQNSVAKYNQSLQFLAVAYVAQLVHAWFIGRGLEAGRASPLSDTGGGRVEILIGGETIPDPMASPTPVAYLGYRTSF